LRIFRLCFLFGFVFRAVVIEKAPDYGVFLKVMDSPAEYRIAFYTGEFRAFLGKLFSFVAGVSS
jgi:hypothetical protein